MNSATGLLCMGWMRGRHEMLTQGPSGSYLRHTRLGFRKSPVCHPPSELDSPQQRPTQMATGPPEHSGVGLASAHSMLERVSPFSMY